MRSNPVALHMQVCAGASTTSWEEKGLMGRDFWHGMSKKAVIPTSVGFGSWWWVNTCCRWTANAIAVSSSLLAQLPSAFLIGGIDIRGSLSLFVAFHKVFSLGEREGR